MFEFGREFRRVFKTREAIGSDPSLLELLNLDLLVKQARFYDIEAGRVGTKDRFFPALEASDLWAEAARRSGETDYLKRASLAAEYAGRNAGNVARTALAAMMQAEVCLLTYDLYHKDTMLSTIEALLKATSLTAKGNGKQHKEEWLSLRHSFLEARLWARQAIMAGVDDLEPSMKAMKRLDEVIALFDEAYKAKGGLRLKLMCARARFERADLLLLIGEDRGDEDIASAVIKEFSGLDQRLDSFVEPLTKSRSLRRLSQALALKGRISGRADLTAEAIKALSREEASHPVDHSPMDALIQQTQLAKQLGALGLQLGKSNLVDKAEALFRKLDENPLPDSLRLAQSIVMDRLGLRIDLAERGIGSKSAQEAMKALKHSFKSELKVIDPAKAPVLWAIYQTQTARLSLIMGDLGTEAYDRQEVIYALSAAHDVFEERGWCQALGLARDGLLRAQIAL
jgi:hypothetical protein